MGIFGKLFNKSSDNFETELSELPGEDPWSPEQGTWGNPNSGVESNPNLQQNWSSRADEMRQYDTPDMDQRRDMDPVVSGERFSGSVSPKDIQLIMSKLDLISSRLDNLSRRLELSEGNKRDRNLW